MLAIDPRERRGLPRRLTAGLCLVLLAVQTGCHTFLPIQESAPNSGQVIALELNDRGRVLVGGQLGESVLRVHGRLLASTDSAVTMSVARTELLQGSSVVWTGENVVIPREGVRGFRVRQFSRGRTVFLVGALVAGVVMLGGLITLAVGGNGRGNGNGGCTTDCNPQ